MNERPGSAASFRAIAALVALCTWAAPAGAQALPHVNVQAFSLESDTSQPRLDTPFHLTVTLHLRQAIDPSGSLQLPLLSSLQILGDERALNATPRGTTYRETITVEAHVAQTISIGPATFEAVDARDGRAKQWSTNGVTLHAVESPERVARRAAVFAGRLLAAAAVGALVMAGALVVALRRSPAPRPEAAQPAVVPPAPQSTESRIREAIAMLRDEPTRAGALKARTLLRGVVGAARGETLRDLKVRALHARPPLWEALQRVERASFTNDDDVRRAVADAVASLERSAS